MEKLFEEMKKRKSVTADLAPELRQLIGWNRKEIFHVHTWRCGHAGDYEDRDYVIQAIGLGVEKITFTDHAPFPGDPFGNRMRMEQLPEYIASMKKLKDEYDGRIEIVAGLEIEYMPSFTEHYKTLRRTEGLECLLLGQHVYEIAPGAYNFSLLPEEKNRREMYGCGQAMIEGIKSGMFDDVAHPDRIFRRRKVWDDDMEKIAVGIIDAAVQMRIPLEVNESSVAAKYYFWPQFWEIAVEKRAAIVYGVDAHCPDELKVL